MRRWGARSSDAEAVTASGQTDRAAQEGPRWAIDATGLRYDRLEVHTLGSMRGGSQVDDPTSEPGDIPWRSRPRRKFWDAVPSLRFLQAMLAFPYICTGVLLGKLREGARLESLTSLIVFAVMAAPETLLLVLWLRRPIARQPTSTPSPKN